MIVSVRLKNSVDEEFITDVAAVVPDPVEVRICFDDGRNDQYINVLTNVICVLNDS